MANFEETICNRISRDELILLTQELVSFRTENPPADYSEISMFLQKKYQSLGLEVQILEGEKGKTNVCARLKGNGESNEILLLSGHMDVVPAGEGWNTNPFIATVQDQSLIGRGTVDMKGSIAAQYLAVKAIVESKIKLKGDLYLFATVDDETAGTMGLRYITETGLSKTGWPKPTFHILGEPSNLNLYVAFKGRMWIRISLAGRSAHGGNPSAGINAIEKMIKLINRITALKRQSHPLMGTDTINIGTISGGQKTNIVPDYCAVTIDYRFVAPQTSVDIEQKLREIISELSASDQNFQLQEFHIFERRESLEVPTNNKYLVSLKSLSEEVLGRNVDFGGVLSAGDAYWTLSNSIPAVFYGPGSLDVAHTNKEFVPLDELEAAARIFATYALRMLG